ncbi:Retrotransposon protein [Gossypium australe]|uniref:Retrotransposon protein n=1 Tax=Gossypium australe TaxID=47621 RepID=A0A5B6WS13_9ROSI|nr:Retrotransposon protein [Gossypium australe]
MIGESRNYLATVISALVANKLCEAYLAFISNSASAKDFSDVFSDELPSVSLNREVEFGINVICGTASLLIAPYRMAPKELADLKAQLQELLGQGFIRPSVSPWGAPVLFFKKKYDTMRMCIDYSQLNKLVIRNKYPLSRIDDLFDQFLRASVFYKIDLRSGDERVQNYFQDSLRTLRVPIYSFWLNECPGCIYGPNESSISTLFGSIYSMLIDDILIYSITETKHNEHFRISKNISKLWSFLRLAGYYRRFFEGFSLIASPLTKLLHKNPSFRWYKENQSSFEKLKSILTQAPI